MKVFLGGTCNGSTWRNKFIELLDDSVEYFNPVVDNWNTEAQEKEYIEKQSSDFRLYVITPAMTGVFSIAEVVDDSNKCPNRTLLCVLSEEDDGKVFEDSLRNSIYAVEKMVAANGINIFPSLESIAKYINGINDTLSLNK